MNERTTTTFFRIDEGFKNLIPPLTAEERSTWKKSVLITESAMLWSLQITPDHRDWFS